MLHEHLTVCRWFGLVDVIHACKFMAHSKLTAWASGKSTIDATATTSDDLA